jgi:large subunit ribosomal protein L17
MRHGDKINNLGRTASHRRALLSNLTAQLIQYKRIQTTLAKAKALRVYAEPIINRAKVDSTHNRRHVFAHLQNKYMVTELFDVIGDKIAGRPGGYLRIIKMPRRMGDAADMALIELVDFNEIYGKDTNEAAKKTRRSRRAGGSAAKTAAPATEATATSATEETTATEAVEIADAPVIAEDAPESQQEKASPEPTTETARTMETPPEHNMPQDPEPEQGNA